MPPCLSCSLSGGKEEEEGVVEFFCVRLTLCFVLSDTHVWVNSPVPTKRENGSNLVV